MDTEDALFSLGIGSIQKKRNGPEYFKPRGKIIKYILHEVMTSHRIEYHGFKKDTCGNPM